MPEFMLPQNDSPSKTLGGVLSQIKSGVGQHVRKDSGVEDDVVIAIEDRESGTCIIWEVTAADESANTTNPYWAEPGSLWYNPETKKLRLLTGTDGGLLSNWLTLITLP